MTLPRIALVGMGKMGRTLRNAMAMEHAAPVVCIDPNSPGCLPEISRDALAPVDVCMEFTQPDSVVNNILRIAEAGKHIVVGTTGWEDRREHVRRIVEDAGVGLVWASNFSIGVHVFARLAAEAAALLNTYGQYDVALHETHHRGKKDAPSGTALSVARAMLAQLDRKTHIESGIPEGVVQEDALYVSSTRVGTVVGRHAVIIDGPHDGIEIVHTARSRDDFAHGALLAATWIAGKSGFYSIEDMFHDIESV